MKNKEIEEILYVLKHIVIGRASRLTCREADKLLSYIEQVENDRDKANDIIKKDRQFCKCRIEENIKLREKVEKTIDKIQDIIDLGFDYDGLNQVDSLKGLIDDLVKIAKEAREILKGDSDDK